MKKKDRVLFAAVLAMAAAPFVIALTFGPDANAYTARTAGSSSASASASGSYRPRPPTSGSGSSSSKPPPSGSYSAYKK